MPFRNILFYSFIFLISTALIACAENGQKKTKIRRTIGPNNNQNINKKTEVNASAQDSQDTATEVTARDIETRIKFIENGSHSEEKTTIKIETLAEKSDDEESYKENLKQNYQLTAFTFHVKDLRQANKDYEALYHRPLSKSLTDTPEKPLFIYTKNFPKDVNLSAEVLLPSFISKDDNYKEALVENIEDDETIKSKLSGFKIIINNSTVELNDTTDQISSKAYHLFKSLSTTAQSTTETETEAEENNTPAHYYSASLTTVDGSDSGYSSEIYIRKINDDKFSVKVVVTNTNSFIQTFILTYEKKQTSISNDSSIN